MKDSLPEPHLNLLYNQDFFAAILFQSPRSPQWKLVRRLCEQADAVAAGGGYFVAAFRKKKESLQLLAVICDMIYTWRSAQIFVQRRKVQYLFSLKWLPCFLKSLPCEPLAWCLAVTDAPKPLDFFAPTIVTLEISLVTTQSEGNQKPEPGTVENHFVCPCKELARYKWGVLELPAGLKEQFHAYAIELGYAECPNFDLEHFKPLAPPLDVI